MDLEEVQVGCSQAGEGGVDGRVDCEAREPAAIYVVFVGLGVGAVFLGREVWAGGVC